MMNSARKHTIKIVHYFVIYFISLVLNSISYGQQNYFKKNVSRGPSSAEDFSKSEGAKSDAPKSDVPRLETDSSVLNYESDSQLSSIFKDIIVVQRQAIKRDKKKFLSFSSTFDFSDGPIDQTALTIKAGYAIHQNWELHLLFTPSYINKTRPVADSVSNLTLANGQKAELISPKAKNAMGAEINWMLAYGKDAWGPYTIIRSDTFFQLHVNNTSYEDGTSGLNYSLGLGKSFYSKKSIHFRAVAGLGSRETTLNNVKQSSQYGFLQPAVFWMF